MRSSTPGDIVIAVVGFLLGFSLAMGLSEPSCWLEPDSETVACTDMETMVRVAHDLRTFDSDGAAYEALTERIDLPPTHEEEGQTLSVWWKVAGLLLLFVAAILWCFVIGILCPRLFCLSTPPA